MIDIQSVLVLIGESEERREENVQALMTQRRVGEGESSFNCSVTFLSAPFPRSSLCLDMSLLLPRDDSSFPSALSLGPQSWKQNDLTVEGQAWGVSTVGRQGTPELREQVKDGNLIQELLVNWGRQGLPAPESFPCARHLISGTKPPRWAQVPA